MFTFKRCPYFLWNGIKSTEFGVFITDFPDIVRAGERVTFQTVQGRSGSLTKKEGDDVYDDVILSVSCGIRDFNMIRKASAALRGPGKLAFPYRPYEHTNARVVNQISFEEFVKGRPNREMKINFRCSPFWYSDIPSVYSLVPLSIGLPGVMSFQYPGDISAQPVITILGTGNGVLKVNDQTVELIDVEDKIVLDCVNQEAFNDVRGMNECMYGEFPVIRPGNNKLELSGDFTEARISFRNTFLI